MTAKEIIEMKQQRVTALETSKAVYDKYQGKEMPAEDKAIMDKADAEFDSLTAKITDAEKRLERERVAGEKEPASPPAAGAVKNEVLTAFQNHLRNGDANTLAAFRNLAQDNPTQAGYLVAPEQFVTELIKGLDDATFMRQKARILPALKGAQSLGFPTRTARMGAAVWGTEIAAPTPDTTLSFGKREFKPNPATAEILVSKTLIRNAPNVDSIVRDEINFVVSSLLETAYMTGDGVGKPLGLFVASNDGISAARDVSSGNSATEIKFDGLMEAKYSVKDQYQALCEWVFHRLAIKQIAKLKDGAGQYIWQPSVVMGAPDMLLGKPVNSSEYAPSTFTANQYVGIYGNPKYYWVCDSLAMEIQVLMELYARTNQVDYIVRIETDGAPILAEAFSRVKLGA